MLEALQWRHQFLRGVNERYQIGVVNLPRDEPVMTASLPSRGLGLYMMRACSDIRSWAARNGVRWFRNLGRACVPKRNSGLRCKFCCGPNSCFEVPVRPFWNLGVWVRYLHVRNSDQMNPGIILYWWQQVCKIKWSVTLKFCLDSRQTDRGQVYLWEWTKNH
jgi:hypothetical protein